MTKEEILLILCKRIGQQTTVHDVDYGRLEELVYLIREVMYFEENKK